MKSKELRRLKNIAILVVIVTLFTIISSANVLAAINNSEAVFSSARDMSGNAINETQYQSYLDNIKNTVESYGYSWQSNGVTVYNLPITDWKRSSNTVSYKCIQKQNKFSWNWTVASRLNTELTKPYQVWDASRTSNSHYSPSTGNGLANGYVTAYSGVLYDAATWVWNGYDQAPSSAGYYTDYAVESLTKFEGTFQIDSTLDLSNMYFTMRSVTGDTNMWVNDNVYVFIYPTALKSSITDSNFMNYLAWWAGDMSTINSYGAYYTKFNGVTGSTTSTSTPTQASALTSWIGWATPPIRDNSGAAIRYGYNQAKNAGVYDGNYTMTVIASDTSMAGGGGMYRLMIGMDAGSKVKYAANGGEGTVADQNKQYGVPLVIRDNGFVRRGYTFSHWNTAMDGSGVSYMPGDLYSAEQSAILYAQWIPDEYNIILNKGNGIEEVYGSGVHYYEEEVTIDADVMNGYTFTGWSGTFDTLTKQYTFVMPDNDIELTATAEDKTAPTVQIIQTPEDPNEDATNGRLTNEDVLLEVIATDLGSGLDELAYSWDNGDTWIASKDYEIEVNNTYTVLVRDKAGNQGTATEVVGNIDKLPPNIDGLEAFANLSEIDRNEGSKTVTVTLTDPSNSDYGASGIKGGTLTVTNSDNNLSKTWTISDTGIIEIDITDDTTKELSELFYGNFRVTVNAEDNVGNTSTKYIDTTEFTLDTELIHADSYKSSLFVKGETGLFIFYAGGYPDEVKVYFPTDAGLDQDYLTVFYYTKQKAIETGVVPFYVPLDAIEGDYTIYVESYKNGKLLQTKSQAFQITEETILDRLQTQLSR